MLQTMLLYVHDYKKGVYMLKLNFKRRSFMTLVLSLGLSMLINHAVQGAVVCKKDGRFWYPENDKAKEIALSLGVKTCNGKRFEAVVKGLGESSNVKKSTKKSMDVEEVIAKFKK